MLVFLCGMMGSGKTSLGKKIASKLHWDFIDLDHFIEQQEHKSVSEIFKLFGEAHFRNIETQSLEKIILNQKNVIVALGGGTPCYNNNMELINTNGLSIFLNVDINKIANRLLNAKNTRPLIAELDSYLKIKEFISTKMDERISFYNQCKIVLEDNNISDDSLINSIHHYISNQL